MPKRFNGGYSSVPIVNPVGTENGRLVMNVVKSAIPTVPIVNNTVLSEQAKRAQIAAGQLASFIRSLRPGRPPLG